MKRIIVLTATWVFFLSNLVFAEQSTIDQITGTKPSIASLKTAVNAELADAETSRQDHETRVSSLESATSNLNNTADIDKPISNATQEALDLKENTANKGVANGYAGLGNDGKVPAAQLPDSTGTDDQTVTDFSLSGTTLSITLENGNTATVDIAGIMDGTGTDDQTITDLSLSGNTLSITLENGNTATVDLSGIVGSGGASAINDLTDVDTTGKAEGKILVFDSSGNLVVGDDQIGESGTGDITDVVAGTGLTGGATAGSATLNLADTAVAPGSYTYSNITVDAQGRITVASSGTQPVTTESDPLFSAWDKDYTDLINTPTIPVNLSDMVDDTTHRWVTDAQITEWGSKLGSESDPLFSAWDKDYADLINTPTLGTAAAYDVGDQPGQIAPLAGACTVGDGAYTDETTCTTNGGSWVAVFMSLCNPELETCDTAQDIISAQLIATRLTAALASYQPIMGADDNYVTDAEKTVIGNTSGTNTGDQDLSGYQIDLDVPDQSEAEAGAATTERVWTAQRIAQAIAALAPGGVDEIVYQADCTTITNGFCIDTDDGAPYYWDGSAVSAISGGAVDLTAPGPIGSETPNTGAFTTLTATSFDTSAPASGETGEIGLQENPDNGTNVITLKAPASLAADLVLTLPTGTAPTSATDSCTAGQWWFASGYWYVCVAADTWQRAALATW